MPPGQLAQTTAGRDGEAHARTVDVRREGREHFLRVPREGTGDDERVVAGRRGRVVAYDLHRERVDAGRDRRDDVRADRRAAQAERDDAAGPAEARGRLPRGARLRRQAGDQACEARRVDTVAEGRVIEHGVRDHGVPYRHSALQTA